MLDQNKESVSKLELYTSATSVTKSELYMAMAALMLFLFLIQLSIVMDEQWFKIAILCLIGVTQIIFCISAHANKTLEKELTELKEEEEEQRNNQ